MDSPSDDGSTGSKTQILSFTRKQAGRMTATIKISPLSNPKNVKLSCELCGKPAYHQCRRCRVTYYCSLDHQSIDFRGIHEKICQLLVAVRAPVTMFGSEEDRKERETVILKQRTHLLELSKTEAHKKLYEGQYDLAIPAALQALRFSMDIYGGGKSNISDGGGLDADSSIKLVPCYLLLGEASVGLHQYAQAEDYLSLAKWAVIKAEGTSRNSTDIINRSRKKTPGSNGGKEKDLANERENETTRRRKQNGGVQLCDIRAQLHRNFGLLYASKELWREAEMHLANDIYYSSLVYGPEHVCVSGGYYHLGQVFQCQNRIEIADVIYEKVVNIWDKFWKENGIERTDSKLGEAQQAEAHQMLTTIEQFRTHQNEDPLVPTLPKTAKVYFVLARLYYAMERIDRTKDYATRAQNIYETTLGREHSSTIEVRNFLKDALRMTKVGHPAESAGKNGRVRISSSRGEDAMNSRRGSLVTFAAKLSNASTPGSGV